MIKGMAIFGQVFSLTCLDEISATGGRFYPYNFMKKSLIGNIYGKAHLNVHPGDYFLLDGFLKVLQIEDKEIGSFFFTSHDHERLILRR